MRGDDTGGAEGAIGRVLHPAGEAAELAELRLALDELEATLGEREALLARYRGDLRAFDARYRATVGARYAELDRLEAEIAEAISSMQPDNEALREKARQARERADESAAALGEELHDNSEGTGFAPSDDLRKLYRRVALAMHPDLCANENEVHIRHELMVEANRAYTSGDQAWLESLLEGTASPRGAGVSADLAWARLRAARAEQKLATIEGDLAELERSELFRLWRAVEAASEGGQDALRDLASSLDRAIARATNRAEVLASVAAKDR